MDCLVSKKLPNTILSSRPSLESRHVPWQPYSSQACLASQDPVRKEVPGAVDQCKKAGIMVRMVTGDNIHTAKHIARECGIYSNGIALEGPQFRRMAETNKEELLRDLPRLQAGRTPSSILNLLLMYGGCLGAGKVKPNRQAHPRQLVTWPGRSCGCNWRWH